jgi:hypothetical protein
VSGYPLTEALIDFVRQDLLNEVPIMQLLLINPPRLETETVGLGTRIKAVNGVHNDEGATTHWFIDAVYNDGRVVPISSQLKTTIVEDANKVVYRMSYKTAKLSL